MARTSRLVVPAMPHLVVQQGNDRQAIFRDDDDYSVFLGWLKEASRQFKVAIHAYVLLHNQLILLATPSDETGLARMMQWVGRYYVPFFNRKYDRTGTLWQGRFRTSVVEAEQYLLSCCRDIERYPVLVGAADQPADYLWSSYAHHVGDRNDPLIIDHSLYWSLGNTPFEREAAYRALVEQAAVADMPDFLKGKALGSEKFKMTLEKRTNHRVLPGKRGRPRKNPVAEDAE